MSEHDAAAAESICLRCREERGDPRGYIVKSIARPGGERRFAAKCVARLDELARTTAEFVREFLSPRASHDDWVRIDESSLDGWDVPKGVRKELRRHMPRPSQEDQGNRADGGKRDAAAAEREAAPPVLVIPPAKLERLLRKALDVVTRGELVRAMRAAGGSGRRGGPDEGLAGTIGRIYGDGRVPGDPFTVLLAVVNGYVGGDVAEPVDVFAELFPGGGEGRAEHMLRWQAWANGLPWGRGGAEPTRDVHRAVRDIWRGGARSLAYLGYRAGAYVLLDRDGTEEKTDFMYSPEWLQGFLEKQAEPGWESGLDTLVLGGEGTPDEGLPDTEATKAASYGVLVRKYFEAQETGLPVPHRAGRASSPHGGQNRAPQQCGHYERRPQKPPLDGPIAGITPPEGARPLEAGLVTQRPFMSAFEARTDCELRHGMMLVPDGEMSFRSLELYCALRSTDLAGRDRPPSLKLRTAGSEASPKDARDPIDRNTRRFLETVGLVRAGACGPRGDGPHEGDRCPEEGPLLRPTLRTYRMFRWLDLVFSSRTYSRLRARDPFLSRFASALDYRSMVSEWCAGFVPKGPEEGARSSPDDDAAGSGGACPGWLTCGECGGACGKDGPSRLCGELSAKLFGRLVRGLAEGAEDLRREGLLFNVAGHAALRRCDLDSPLFAGVTDLGGGAAGARRSGSFSSTRRIVPLQEGASFQEAPVLERFRRARREHLSDDPVERKLDRPCLDRGLVAFPLFDLGDRGCYAHFSVVGVSHRMLIRGSGTGEEFDVDHFARFERAVRGIGTPWAAGELRGREAPPAMLDMARARTTAVTMSAKEWLAVREIPLQEERQDLLDRMQERNELRGVFRDWRAFEALQNLHPWHLPGGKESDYFPWSELPEQTGCPVLWKLALSRKGKDVLNRWGYPRRLFTFGPLDDWRRPPVRAIVNDSSKEKDLSRCVGLWQSAMAEEEPPVHVHVPLPFAHDYLWFNVTCLLESISEIVRNVRGECGTCVTFSEVFFAGPDPEKPVRGLAVALWNTPKGPSGREYVTFDPGFPGDHTLQQKALPLLAKAGALWLFYSGETGGGDGLRRAQSSRGAPGYSYKVVGRDAGELRAVGETHEWDQVRTPPTFALFIPAGTSDGRWRPQMKNVWHVNPSEPFDRARCDSITGVLGGIEV